MIPLFQSLLGPQPGYLAGTVAWILLLTLPLLAAVAMIVWVDRKVWAAIQMRKGPNVVGPFGILQSAADGLKLFLKETIVPSGANQGIFLLAPAITFSLALVAWAVIPFSAGYALADINVGLLYLFAVSSLGVYGIIMSGWASNSKYPFLGGLRSAAQMVSYEVSIGFVIVCVVLYAAAWGGVPHGGDLAARSGCVGHNADAFNLSTIVCAQRGTVWGVLNANIFNPLLIPMAVIFFVSALAETNRPPFDLPEAESELVAGYQVEYSSMSFALFQLGEYANILLMCALMSVLFLGGWLPPVDWAPLYLVPGGLWFVGKAFLVFVAIAAVKALVPRYRYDQLMRLGWKVFLPLSLLWVFLISGWLVLSGKFGDVSAVPTAGATEVRSGPVQDQNAALLLGQAAIAKKLNIQPAKRQWWVTKLASGDWKVEGAMNEGQLGGGYGVYVRHQDGSTYGDFVAP